LVGVFDMRIVLLQLNGGLVLVLDSNDERFVNAGGFLHELLGATDGVVIGGLVVSLSGLRDGQLVENVLFLALVNEEVIAELLNL